MKHFHPDEFRCQHCGGEGIKSSFVEKLDDIRDECGFPFLISSGYRCPEHPIEAKKEKPGAHSTGHAADIAVTGEQAIRVLEVAIKHGIKRIGVNQKGGGRFIHLDTAPDLPSPAIWSY